LLRPEDENKRSFALLFCCRSMWTSLRQILFQPSLYLTFRFRVIMPSYLCKTNIIPLSCSVASCQKRTTNAV